MKTVSVSAKNLKKFVTFPDELYRNDEKYVPYLYGDLMKTLRKLLLAEKCYCAYLTLDDAGNALARILLTVAPNKQLKTDKCCFFSLYECVDDPEASRQILEAAREYAEGAGATHLSGTYFPYDPDNRRGILCEGFDSAPMIFTSYNPAYYNDQMTAFGFEKHTDTYEYRFRTDPEILEKVKKLGAFAMRHGRFRVDHADFGEIDRDVCDIRAVMDEASNEVIYQDAPGVNDLYGIMKQWRPFLNPDYLLIARENDTNRPIGVAIALPDFFRVIRKTGGKPGLLTLLRLRSMGKKIDGIRGILQYVIPEYQDRGVIVALYDAMRVSVEKNGITEVEGGTIMEKNAPSNTALTSIGAEVCHVYRLYVMPIGGGTDR